MEFVQQVIFALSLIVLTLIIVYSFLNRKTLGAYPLLIQTAVTIVWTVASLFEFNSHGLADKVFWRNVEQIGIFIGPIASLFFAIGYSKQVKLKKYAYAVMLVPVTALVLIFTDQYHHLMRESCTVFENELFGRGLVVKSTPLGRLFVVFNFCIPFLSIAVLLDFMRRSSRFYRKRVLWVIGSIVLLLVMSWLRVSYLEKKGFFIPGAVLYTPSALILFYSLFRYKFFSVSPVARDKVFDVIREGIIVTDAEGSVVDVNMYAAHMLRCAFNQQGELLGMSLRQLFQGEPELLERVLHQRELAIELQLCEKPETYISVHMYPLFHGGDEVIGAVIILNDVTEKKNYELYLQEKVHRDSLTGLYNRSGLKNKYVGLMHDAYTMEAIAVLMIDIDLFKTVNDTYGHLYGDRVIQHLAAVLEEELQDQGIVARFGGEEFAVLLPGTSKQAAFETAESIRKRVEDSVLFTQEEIPITYTISIGIQACPNTMREFEELLHEADTALYMAKKHSRNCTFIYGEVYAALVSSAQ